MTKLLLSQDIHPEGRKMLEGSFDIIIPADTSQEALLRAAAGAEGIILRTTSGVTREVIAAAPKLKIISRTGAGVDNVDVAAATERGILVCNLPAVNNLSVAEHTIAMILSLAKDLPAMDRAVRSGAWKQRNAGRAVELEGKSLGVVGMGNIGSLVARKCALGLGMKILAYDPYAADKFKGEDYVFVPALEKLFAEADFVTLHCPNIPETKGMVTGKLLSSMKAGAWIVNCARGGVVDEGALYDVLKEKRIAGAALDVFSAEPPPPDSPLLSLENLIVSPHAAALTKEATIRMSTQAAAAVLDFFSGRRPRYVYNAKDLGLS
ncbi:MAG: hydroxyacid dehydrogenase [Spirochaetales bacterium]|jgi:D-3-phosphoglycerate dehydrogenase|nr:hydroxyacid dehydrogenase [Spirochaetales bacterium]